MPFDSLDLISDEEKFDKEAYDAFIATHISSDSQWMEERRLLGDVCLSALNASFTGGQQAVYLLTCLQWSLLLDCDLHEKDGESSGAASCRRAAFLAGDCPLSPPAMLLGLPGVASENSWEGCVSGLSLPDSDDRDEQCRQLDVAAVQLVSCRLQQYVGTSGQLDVDRLRSDVTASEGEQDVKDVMLHILEVCGGDAGSVETFVDCWAMNGIMSCAASEATQRALRYESC